MTKHIISLVLLLAVLAFGRDASAEGKKLAVVVAKGSPLTNITRADLKHAFEGDSVVAGGKPLVPFNFSPGSAERAGFDAAILGKSEAEVGNFWVDRKVRGQSGAPRALPSAAHVAKVVAKFPNAIGYLPVDAITSDVQAVKIDGVAHTDARYKVMSR